MHALSSDWWSLEELGKLLAKADSIQLSTAAYQQIEHCYQALQEIINDGETLHYGINTGFGSLCDVRIESSALEELQANLVRSHACGFGEEVPPELVKIILLLKIKSLSLGHSGIRPALVQRLVELYNAEVWPVLFQLGSLGASGDLAPLAHLSLPLIGEGEVHYKGQRQASAAVLNQLGLAPLTLQAKEGLALLNGTQFSTAYGVWAMLKAERLSKLADLVAALSMDAYHCAISPFDERLHKIRPHQGQLDTAANIWRLLIDSPLVSLPKESVQDPYAFRCVPQVHGASKDALAHSRRVIETEINSVTDNPNIFPASSAILSGGNFHAQPIALVLDFSAIALAELGSISERRLYQLISGQRGLPPFLTTGSGLHSGLMITQYTAASIVSQNKQWCTPASVDSIVSCNGQEDHVSMAANAGTKLYKVVENVERLLAIELIAAAQGLHLRKRTTSPILQGFLDKFRTHVAPLEGDRLLHNDMEAALKFIQEVDLEAYYGIE